MKKLDLITLTKEFQKIQLAAFNEKNIIVWLHLYNSDSPYLNVTLFNEERGSQISYNFFNFQTDEEIFEQLDNFSKQIQHRQTFKDIVEELKNKYKD